MLGSNLGKKVTAGVVQDEYKQFLKNKPDEHHKKTLTAEERKEAKRVEMRKRGIFVKADDPDETPTLLEKTDGVLHPMLFVLPEKPTLWKRTKKTERRKKSSVKRSKKLEEPSGPSKKKTKQSKPSTKSVGSRTSLVSIKTPKMTSSEKSGKSPKEIKEVVKQEEKVVQPMEVKVEEMKVEEKVAEKVEKMEKKHEEVPKVEEKMEEKHEEVPKVEERVEVKEVKEVKSEEKVAEKHEEVPKAETPPPDQPSTRSEPSKEPSITDMKKAIPMAEKQTDAFDRLDDDEFEKMTSDADEKEMLKLAPRLLKVAKKHAAMEKCLSSEENEVLAKFFSGKQKLDAHVLEVLDAALDKIIDYLQKNNCAVDEETKAVMKKRDKLKAAMMKEFLVSPQYLPKTWTAKFNAWKSEAEKQKNGINWFRVFFSYPKHKSFDDGPEDTFGNFRRRQRSLWMGIVLGPGDVKSFEDTKREDDCQGMFLDTRIIENAADATTTTDRRK